MSEYNNEKDQNKSCPVCNKPNKIFCRGMCSSCYKKQKRDEREKIPCACGCGTLIPIIGRDGRPNRYAYGHNFGKRENHPNWKGGFYPDTDGYIWVFRPDHPNSNKQGYLKRSRLVMSEHLGRPLREDEHIHHKNKQTDDDRIENLEIVSQSQHMSIHHTKDMTGRKCIDPECKDPYTTGKDNQGYDAWFRGPTPDQWYCKNCYSRNKKRERDALKPKYRDELANRICSVPDCLTPHSVIDNRSGKPRWYKSKVTGLWICQSHKSKESKK